MWCVRTGLSTSKGEHTHRSICCEAVLLWDSLYCMDFSLKGSWRKRLKSIAGTATHPLTVTGLFLTSEHCALFQDDGGGGETEHKTHIKARVQGLQVNLWTLPLWWPRLIFPQPSALNCFYLTVSFWKLLWEQDKVRMTTRVAKQMYELYKVRWFT